MKTFFVVVIMLLIIAVTARLADYYWLYPNKPSINLEPIAVTSFKHGSRELELDKHPNVNITGARLVLEAVDHAHYEVTYDLEAIDGVERYWISAHRHKNGHSQPMSGFRPGRAVPGYDNVTKVSLSLIDRSQDNSESDSIRFGLYSIPHRIAKHDQFFAHEKQWCKKRAVWWKVMSQCAEVTQE